jgi:hypothetical protein
MARQLLIDFRRGQNTVASIINDPHHGWSSVAEGNTPQGAANYIATVARALGVRPDQALNLLDPNTLAKMMSAMAAVEAGKSNAWDPQIFAQAAQGLLGGGSRFAQRDQHNDFHTNIHVYGSPDPFSTAQHVVSAQRQVNAETTRRMKRVNV